MSDMSGGSSRMITPFFGVQMNHTSSLTLISPSCLFVAGICITEDLAFQARSVPPKIVKVIWSALGSASKKHLLPLRGQHLRILSLRFFFKISESLRNPHEIWLEGCLLHIRETDTNAHNGTHKPEIRATIGHRKA